MLILSRNKINGSIPDRIDNLASLSMISLGQNMLTGHIPRTIGRLQNLQVLSLAKNRLSGLIPDPIVNLTQLDDLRLRDNDLQGSIPLTLKNCKFLDFSKNKLNGTISKEAISIPSLSILFSLAHNSLVGSLPREIGSLKNLGKLNISDNRLSGEIPRELGDCESMEYLSMQGNLFTGSIPSTFSNLRGMRYLDLSHNNFSRQVPNFLESLNFLWYLNLSYNDFDGIVPKGGVFMNASAISVQGNTKLCGGVPTLQLPSCTVQNSKKKRGAMQVIVPIICALSGLSLLLCLFTSMYCVRKKKKIPPMNTPFLKSHKMVSYHDLVKATNGFSLTNLIGEGSFDKVYRGTLDSSDVAVKVLNLDNRGASKSFMTECETIRRVRHRNLVKITTVCSSEVATGDEFKALVYEFMPNGSLNDWLHPALEPEQKNYSKALNFYQRLSVRINITAALDYLHHQCEVPIVHCDLKPSNVLLDDDMNALVGDFGLAKILLFDGVTSRFQTSSIGIKGSMGYIPPEYGLGGDVSTKGDVYSYGILLLEMFTGKRPTDDSFNGGSCIHEFVKTAYPEGVMEILDSQLLAQEVKVEAIHTRISSDQINNRITECAVSLIGIGLACSAMSPKERPEMKSVFTKMHAIEASLLREENCNRFLNGAASIDNHFKSTPFENNIPVLLGLLSVWNVSFFEYPARAILPYSQALEKLAPHIQQVSMESNGKGVSIDGVPLPFEAGEIDFGEPGTNGQHSFYQLIHQGRVIPCDFIGVMKTQQPVYLKGEIVSNHDELMSNFFAQPDALAYGKTPEQLLTEKVPDHLIPHKTFSGDRPSVSLLLPSLGAYNIGQLLAIYEHRIAVEGFVWGINSFDQWGVELGKSLASQVRKQLHLSRTKGEPVKGFNFSTTTLLSRYLEAESGIPADSSTILPKI